MTRLTKRSLDCANMTIEEAERWGESLSVMQRDIMFAIGDLARYAEARWPDTHSQVWPEWVSPGMVARAAGVCRAYPLPDDRRHECTYSQYMQHAGKRERHELLDEIEQRGMTTDESRKPQAPAANTDKPRWLLAFDTHYYTHRTFFSGAGVETADAVAHWTKRTIDRLREKGATDALCAFEGAGSFRRELTEEWEHRYKDRPPKPDDLKHQVQLVRELLEGMGIACVSADRHEADDVLASAAKQFPGRVTILSADKDLRQCLSGRVNILLDVEWSEDPLSGDAMPEYRWLTESMHTEATGIPPSAWSDYQAIMGDTTDNVQGAIGIGEKGAANLIKEFGSAAACIQAAKEGDSRLSAKQRASLLEFESRFAITMQLVEMVDSLHIPTSTRI